MVTFTLTFGIDTFTGKTSNDLFVLSYLTFFGAAIDTPKISATLPGTMVLDDRINNIELITLTGTGVIKNNPLRP